MSELHDKAMALLALREKATPGPWRHDADTYGDPEDVSVYAGEDFIANMGVPGGSIAFDVQPSNGRFIAAAHDMADTIVGLLAENERLTLALDGSRHAVSYWTEQHAAAEARLRALCEQEPVRYEFDWFDPGLERYDENWGELRPRHGQTMQQKVADIESYQRLDGKGQMYRVRRLIPRPSMEDKP